MQITNERAVHDHEEEKPLRDLIWDMQEKWAKHDNLPEVFKLTETWGIIQLVMFFLMLAFHKHRLIIFRRFMFILGTLYLYRCGTTIVTSLPVPGLHITCQ